MSERIKGIVNTANPHEVQRIVAGFYAMTGMVRVDICQYRPRRTDRQNKWYWPCFVRPFATWLAQQSGAQVDECEEKAHKIFKDTFLRVPITTADGEQVFLPNGDPMMRTRSTSELSTLEFNGYLDNCAELLLDLCKFRVPEPNIYHEAESKSAA